MNSIPNVKFVVFDICSEYGVKILDSLRSLPSRVVLTEPLPEHGNVVLVVVWGMVMKETRL